ncbi:Elongator subunit elp2 [Microbotryomycetes sp. JL201]|nr:Elongator subunit elp2 [Microbotryomycetes sp. JL201]
MARVETQYISCGANRANVSASRPSDGLVAFGSGPLVALWHSSDPKHRGVHATLAGHDGQISALKFLDTTASDTTSKWLATGDSTGSVILWLEQPSNQWTRHAILKGHTNSVSAIAMLEMQSSSSSSSSSSNQQLDLLVVTGASDATAQAWHVTRSGAELVQQFKTGGRYPLDMALSYLPSSHSVVLAVGCTENKIQIYTTRTSESLNFVRSLSLEGHSDWVRCLDFTTPLPLDGQSTSTYDVLPGQVFLASGSQDNYIRLWRFTRVSDERKPDRRVDGANGVDDALAELERTLAQSSTTDEEQPEGELRVTSHDFTIDSDGTFSCAIEAVLLGHDAWVTGVHWAPRPRRSPTRPLALLSASADRSMILWTPSTTTTVASTSSSISSSTISSLWTTQHRFGEFSSATNLGFFGALWGKDARTVLASGWGGSWHVWTSSSTPFSNGSASTGADEGMRQWDEEEWTPTVATGGHFAEVNDVKWDREGRYLLSTGNDMTTRLHAPWRRSTVDGRIESWHELGRPQIHGYQIGSLDFVSPVQFVSGADEKIVRVFDAPKVVVRMLRELSEIELGDEADRPMAANVPPLGLSNRAIADSEEAVALGSTVETDPITGASLPLNFEVESHPPFEEQLLGSTLWPETEKLYGHGFEIVAVAVANSLPILACVCKATSPEHAVIRLYDTRTWRATGHTLQGHALTITSIKFSSDDRWLVSVSRDRSWQLYERNAQGDGYELVESNKNHARIIWDVCWAKDDSFFATASRDKTVKVWSIKSSTSNGKVSCSATISLNEAATSIACTRAGDQHVLAVGLENGQIRLLSAVVGSDRGQWSDVATLDAHIAHVRTVTALDFCPTQDDVASGTVRLASASEDRSVRIYDITLQ